MRATLVYRYRYHHVTNFGGATFMTFGQNNDVIAAQLLAPKHVSGYGRENAPSIVRVVKTPTLLKSCHFGKKALRFKSKLGLPLIQGLVCPKHSKLEVNDLQVILDHFYTIPQMNGPQIFVFQKGA